MSRGVFNEVRSDIIEIQFFPVFIPSSVTDFVSIRKRRDTVHIQLKRFTHVNECDVVTFARRCLLFQEWIALMLIRLSTELTTRPSESDSRSHTASDIIKLFMRSVASYYTNVLISQSIFFNGRSRWPRGLRRRSAAAWLLGSRVRIALGAWIFVCCVYMLCCPV
jgi:hypothetical protein